MAKKNIPRAAIHAKPQTQFTPLQAHENTRVGGKDWYDRKNEDTSHHYDFSRKGLNFCVTADGVKPLSSTNTEKLHGRYLDRLAELDYHAFKEDAPIQRNSYIDWVFSGDHDVMAKLAFGDQKVDFFARGGNEHIKRMPEIEQYGIDVYNFACRKFGKDNVIGVEVHLDEMTPHAHVNIIPTAIRQQRGRATSIYVNKKDPTKTITSKEYRKLNSKLRADWEKTDQVERTGKLAVSYSGLMGETRAERGKYLRQFHTDFHEEVGKKYGLARGRYQETLTEEEQKGRRHKTSAELEAERQEMIKEMKELDEQIAARKKEWKDLNERTGFLARAGKRWGLGDSAANEQKVKDAETRAIQAEVRATQAENDAKNALNTAKKEVYDSVKDTVRQETVGEVLGAAKIIWGKDENGKPVIPTTKDLGEWCGKIWKESKKVKKLEDEKEDLAQKLEDEKDKGRADKWLLKELLRCPDRQLWNDLKVFENPTGWRCEGTYAGVYFNTGFSGKIEDASLKSALTSSLKLPYNMATAVDEGLRETVAVIFMSYIATQIPTGGGGGGGSDDNWWKKKDEDWYVGAFRGAFSAAQAQLGRSRSGQKKR